MSDFPSYESIADQTLGDITEPKIIPIGTWEGELRGGKAQKSRSETQPHRAYFPIKFVRPTDNVSPAMMDDFTDELLYFGDPAVVKEMFEHVPSFYDFETAITGGLSEFRFA